MFRKERKKKDGFSDGWSFHPWQTFVSDTRTWRWEAAKNTDFSFFSPIWRLTAAMVLGHRRV